MEIKVTKVHQLTGHNGAIYSLSEGEAKHLLLTGAGDGWVVQWDLVNPEVGRLIAKSESQIFSICYVLHPEQLLVLGTLDGGVHWIPTKDIAAQKNVAHHTKGVFDIQKIDNYIYTIGGDGVLSKWSIEKKRCLESLQLANFSLRAMAYSQKRKELAVAASDRNIYIIDLEHFSLKTTIESAHGNSVFSIAYSPDNQYLVSGGRDALLRVWNVQDNFSMHSSQPAHLYTINAITFHQEKKIMATASRDKTIKIWHSETFELLKVIDTLKSACHINSINHLLWSPYNNWLISGSDDKTAIIWDIEVK